MAVVIDEMRKFVAPEFIIGTDVRMLAGRYAKNLGARKVFLVSDAGVEKQGWVDDIKQSLEEKNICYTLFNRIKPNPTAEQVMEGADIYKKENCNTIIVIGGGSPIDCAKGIGVVVTNSAHILNFEGVDKIQYPVPPLICIPTTAGTAADISQFSIITDTDLKIKKAIISKAIVPDVALIDPVVTTTLDNYLTATTGLDALTHAIEAFVSNANSPITDLHALEAIRLIKQYLKQAYDDPNNYQARYYMMIASLQAGLAFSNASLGAVHAMAHSLGGFLDLPHGECNALLLPHVIRFNYIAEPDRYNRIAEILRLPLNIVSNKQQQELIIKAVNELKSSVGINYSLQKIGVKNNDIPMLSQGAVKDPCLVTNPRKANKRDLEIIYEEAI